MVKIKKIHYISSKSYFKNWTAENYIWSPTHTRKFITWITLSWVIFSLISVWSPDLWALKFICCFKSNVSYLFPWKRQQRTKLHYLIEQILSYKTLFFNIVTTNSYAFSPAKKKSLHATLVVICTSGGDPLFHNCYDSVVAKKILPMQSIFHWFKKKDIRSCQIWTVAVVWQFSQDWQCAPQSSNWCGAWCSFPNPEDSAHHFTFWGLHLEFLQWGIHMSSLHGLERFTLYCHTTNMHLWYHMVQYNKIGGITFGVASYKMHCNYTGIY